jgi:hypothetical protein
VISLLNVKVLCPLITTMLWVVTYVRRQANKIAHCIARASLSLTSPYIYHDALIYLYSLLSNEMN